MQPGFDRIKSELSAYLNRLRRSIGPSCLQAQTQKNGTGHTDRRRLYFSIRCPESGRPSGGAVCRRLSTCGAAGTRAALGPRASSLLGLGSGFAGTGCTAAALFARAGRAALGLVARRSRSRLMGATMPTARCSGTRSSRAAGTDPGTAVTRFDVSTQHFGSRGIGSCDYEIGRDSLVGFAFVDYRTAHDLAAHGFTAALAG